MSSESPYPNRRPSRPEGDSYLAPIMRLSFALALLPAIACAGGATPNAKTTIVSFVDLDCSDCGEDLARALIATDGVRKTAFDKAKAELTVVADSEIDVFSLAQKKKPKDEAWSLLPGAGKGHYVPWKTPKDGSDVKQITTNGEDVVDIAAHLAPGKVTIIDFSAKWCEPCRVLDEHVLKLIETQTSVAYRKFEIGDWDTPLATRHLKGIKELPYVLIFDKGGKQVDALTGLNLPAFDKAVNQALEAK